MHLYRKIALVLVILVFSGILWGLLAQRRKIVNMQVGTGGGTEGMIGKPSAAQQIELKSITVTSPSPGISTVAVTKNNYPLREYCIKSAFNAAYSGSYMNLDTIKYVLSRGCRFLDFPVYLINGAPCVAYSTDPTGVTMSSNNNLNLNDVLNVVGSYGFSAPSPNLGDPMFVQLRILTSDPNLYKLTAQAVALHLTNKLYKGRVTGSTMLGSLMGKVVLVIDKTSAPNYAQFPVCGTDTADTGNTCYNLANYVNMESGGDLMLKYSYTSLMDLPSNPPHVFDTQMSDVSTIRVAEPQPTDGGNPLWAAFISKYGVQVVGNRFYVSDPNLVSYETFFREHQSAFVPFHMALPHIAHMDG